VDEVDEDERRDAGRSELVDVDQRTKHSAQRTGRPYKYQSDNRANRQTFSQYRCEVDGTQIARDRVMNEPRCSVCSELIDDHERVVYDHGALIHDRCWDRSRVNGGPQVLNGTRSEHS
jgi:formylmethanofuran dehydrogenase subunit E